MKGFASLRSAIGLIGLGCLVFGCGGGSTSSSVARDMSYRGTQAPGDVWSYTIGAETFTATNSTLAHDYTGSVVSLSSGFKKLTIASSTDSEVHAGDVAYSIEIPETALIVKPVNGAAVVACGVGEQAATASLQYNWIAIPEEDWAQDESSAYGTALFTIDGANYSGAVTSYHANDTINKQFTDTFTYVNGALTQPESPDLNGAMTPSGTFMLDFGPQHGGAIGVKRPATNLDPNEISNRTFIGVSVAARHSDCVQAVGHGDGSFTANDYVNVEAGTLNFSPEHSCSVVLGTQIQPGLFKAVMSAGGEDHAMIVAVNKAAGKWVLYAFGTDDGAYNVMLVER